MVFDQISVTDPLNEELSHFVWSTRYRDDQATPSEDTIEKTWGRVARAAAAIEREPDTWYARFLELLRGFRFIPGGRILAGAGTTRQVTLYNCFVMGRIDDSLEGIFDALKEGALTMQQGGGVGYDFSTIRPRGSFARATGTVASGPVSFLTVWDAMCGTILSTGARRGAMMATLRCDHPDVEEFIEAKREPGRLRHFNLSVLVTDDFMKAVKNGDDWALIFPILMSGDCGAEEIVQSAWGGNTQPAPCRVFKRMSARDLWQRICDSAYETAEPGVLFIDRINANNNLAYCETLSATNPCAEEPLPPYGGCNLGSLNLTAFVSNPFMPAAHLDLRELAAAAALAVRFLDDITEISRFPLFRQYQQIHRCRRIGLGVTGLADALAMLTLRYDSAEARVQAARAMECIRNAAYAASVDLARERGAFPEYRADAYPERPFIRALPAVTQAAIRSTGIRNSHLLAIAPAGTISLLAGNVSSGIEPAIGIESTHRIIGPDGRYRDFQATDYAYASWRSLRGPALEVPSYFVGAEDIAAEDHLLMQAALQPFVDGAIAKTITLGANFPKSEASTLLISAYEHSVKGCALYRPTARPAVIAGRPGVIQAVVDRQGRYCDVEQECD